MTINTNDAKRGSIPADKQYFAPEALEKLRKASRHVCYLVNEGYDLKMAYTFVGNHFSLSERQRLAIARSIATTEQLTLRKTKEKTSVKSEEVWIDGFNTVITLEVMLCNSILFDCMDGTVRDLAALRGSYRIIPETETAIKNLLDILTEMQVSTVHILLDEPVSNSGRLKTLIAEIGEKYSLNLDIQIMKEVDKELYSKENVITSDSIVLDNCKNWINLTKKCLKNCGANILKVWE